MERFNEIIKNEKFKNWILAKNKNNNIIDDSLSPIELEFVKIDYRRKVYIFRAKNSYLIKNMLSNSMTLTMGDTQGDKINFKRKTKALVKLADQTLLVNSIVNPIDSLSKISYTHEFHKSFEKLDQVKQQILSKY
jgi:hypothetical protein